MIKTEPKKYVLALDEGTSSARCALFDTKIGKIVAAASQSVRLMYPRAGWVEQDAQQLYSAQHAALFEVLAKNAAPVEQIAGIGITNQRETVIAWDKTTKKPICPAIVWQCRRTSDVCRRLRQDPVASRIIPEKTGLVIDPYFSATKIAWILENVRSARQKAAEGRLLVGTVDSWLIYCLTEGRVHVTDVSNASRTMLFNIHTLDWDDELLALFGVPRHILPRVIASDERVGVATALKAPLEICGVIGDQQSALFGHRCFDKGSAKCTYGTGCFILANTGSEPLIKSGCADAGADDGGSTSGAAGLISTVAWKAAGATAYAAEGSVFNAGSAVQWLRDNLGFFAKSRQSEQLALEAKNCDGTPGCDGVYVVPAFTGLGAPHWNSEARGIVCGITRGTTAAHITRATLESMAYSVRDVIGCMGGGAYSLAVDGGAAGNNFLMQFQSDILNLRLTRPKNREITATGAALMCGLGLGIYKDLEEIRAIKCVADAFEPKMPQAEAQRLYEGWKCAVERCI